MRFFSFLVVFFGGFFVFFCVVFVCQYYIGLGEGLGGFLGCVYWDLH